MSIVVVTPPATSVVSPADVRTALGLDATAAPDAQLTPLIAAATQEFDGPDGMLRRTLLPTTYDLFLEPRTWRAARARPLYPAPIDIPLPPLRSSPAPILYWIDRDGTETVLNVSTYRIVPGTPATVLPIWAWGWFSLWHGFRLRYAAGYDTPADVPQPIRQAIILRVGQLRSMGGRADPLLKQDSVIGVSTRQWETQTDINAQTDRAILNLVRNYVVPLL